MSNKNSQLVEKIIERYKSVHNLKKDEDAAKRIGLSKSALSNQKKRGKLDLQKVILSCAPDVNIDWLIRGEGNPKRVASDLDEKFSRYEGALTDLDSTDIKQDDLLEFLVGQQESVLDFLRKLKADRSDE